jgi:UDP-N-acetylglucosamine diphosphorylase/glucosamine-1-phosphate N-acetyltransferase
MNYILFQSQMAQKGLQPFSLTRPISEIRLGILTITEKWELALKKPVSFLTKSYLQKKYPLVKGDDNLLINGAVLPDKNLLKAINALLPGQILFSNPVILAARINKKQLNALKDIEELTKLNRVNTDLAFFKLRHPWEIFKFNGEEIRKDFILLTKGRKSQKISKTNQILGKNQIFIESGAKIECSILNATNGPIYIGKNAEIMEGSLIRGPFALGEGAVIKMGAKIYGDTTIGPYCKVGGEVNNSVMFANSNKAHDGYIGNTVIGEWCNLGADTNTSNLKNNYANVEVLDFQTYTMIDTGLQFCGLIMGDHSKCGINTMFNTGTVVGVNTNIFGTGFPIKFIPSFAWGGSAGFTTYRIDQAIEVAKKVFERRGKTFDKIEQDILKHLFNTLTKTRVDLQEQPD